MRVSVFVLLMCMCVLRISAATPYLERLTDTGEEAAFAVAVFQGEASNGAEPNACFTSVYQYDSNAQTNITGSEDGT